jgi:hypothetical protein
MKKWSAYYFAISSSTGTDQFTRHPPYITIPVTATKTRVEQQIHTIACAVTPATSSIAFETHGGLPKIANGAKTATGPYLSNDRLSFTCVALIRYGLVAAAPPVQRSFSCISWHVHFAPPNYFPFSRP